jgi:hypothetical protein
MDVTFRESKPFYGEPTYLSQLFAKLDQIHFVKDGHEGENAVLRTQCDSVGTNTDNDVQVQVQQPIVGTIQAGSLQFLFRIDGQKTLRYILDGSHRCRGSSKIVGGQKTSRCTLDGSHVCRGSSKRVMTPQLTREAAMKGEAERKALYEMHALQTIFDGHDIGNFVSYESLSPSYRAFVASLQTVSIPKDWKTARQDLKWREAMIEELEALKKNKTWVLTTLPARKKGSKLQVDLYREAES